MLEFVRNASIRKINRINFQTHANVLKCLRY